MKKILTGVICIWLVSTMLLAATTGPNIKDVTGIPASTKTALAITKNTAGGPVVSDSNNQIPASAVKDLMAVASSVPVTDNATFKASGSSVVAVPHPAPVSSASATVTIDSTYVNTTSPNIANGASNAVWTIPLSASMPVNVGDSIGVQQEGAGTVTISGVSATVTVNGQGDKKTTCGLHGTLLAIYNGYIASHDVSNVFGCRQ